MCNLDNNIDNSLASLYNRHCFRQLSKFHLDYMNTQNNHLQAI